MSKDLIDTENALLVVACAGAINQELYQLIELLNLEIQILKRLLSKRPKLHNDERRRLAAMASELDRRILKLSEHIVTIDSLRRWYRKLIARTYAAKNRGRKRMDAKQEELICKMALANPNWGEDAISQRLKLLGIILSDRGVSLVLKRNGIPPVKERSSKNIWSKFLQDHWPHLYAIDFATFEIPGDKRTYRCHALYAMRLSTREVKLLGVRSHANGRWTAQLARNECDEEGFFADAQMIIMDRDPMFRGKFRAVLESFGITVKLLPPKSPNLNAYIERFIGTVRREVCQNYIPLDEDRLRERLQEHVKYYNTERTHQGREDLLMPDQSVYYETAENKGAIRCKSRVGNLLNYYYRDVG